MNLVERATKVQEDMRKAAHLPEHTSGVVTVRAGEHKFQAVAQGRNTGYYVDGVKATKAQQIESLVLALAQEDAKKAKTVDTVEKLKALPPGTYTVTGEASAYLTRQQVEAELTRRWETRRAKSQLNHQHRARQKLAAYTMNIINAMHHMTSRYGAYVKIVGKTATMVEPPKRPIVANRLVKLIKIYNTLVG